MWRTEAASAAPVEPAETSAVGLAGGDGPGGADDRRVLLRPHGADRLLVVADRDRARRRRRAPSSATRAGRAEDAHGHAGAAGALGDHLEAAVGPVGVERDHRASRG